MAKRKGESLDAALKTVRNVINRLRWEQSQPLTENVIPRLLFSQEGLGGFMLSGDTADFYSSALDDIYGAVSQLRPISRRQVESYVESAILTSISLSKQSTDPFEIRLEKALAQLADELNAPPKKWRVDIEIGGVDLEKGDTFSFGDLEFYRMTELTAPQHLRESWATEGRRAIPLTDRQAMLGRIYAKLQVECVDRDFALELANDRVSGTLDNINFFVDFLFPSHSRAYLIGEDVRARTASFLSPEGANEGHVTLSWRGKIVPLSLDGVQPSKTTFYRVSELLRSNSTNELQRKVLGSMRWSGRASVTRSRGERFLLHMIALESLVGGKRSSSNQLAVRAAHLLTTTYKAARDAYDRVLKLYDIRSRIVHDGITDVTDEDLFYARVFAKSAAVECLVKKPFVDFSTANELSSWFQRQVLTVQERPE